MTPFKARLIAWAWTELETWLSLGNHESDPRLLNRLRQYGRAAGLTGAKLESWAADCAADRKAWSAAFISFLFASAGAGPDFPVSTAHSHYVTRLKALMGCPPLLAPFQTWPVGSTAVQAGDLVCRWRGQAVTFEQLDETDDVPDFFPSHCDLIVEVNGQRAVGIGGNVHGQGYTVGTVNYVLHANGTLNHPQGYAIVKNFK
jgi:hypothetical protein